MATKGPEARFFEMSKAHGQVTEADVEAVFDQLKPVKPDFLLGEWAGGSLDTGHPGHKNLVSMRWAGKAMRSVNDVDPIIVLDDEGKRTVKEEYGHASLREVAFRGVLSTAMIYDAKPILDHFRCVDENTVLGAMDCPKLMGDASTYYFFLTRL
ncbi:putative transcription factor cmr1 protein [Neofusicoccum parvum UCRNP2]|uniref:Putative transcription factor cmr1 protein n=1 Tax=Botryosphaeria parva (strain UCR-NP2) TaxID=1287680 RepID=R1GDM7_BOTPV|nr:putative transcription factor cmr1 protein [Neofusicoccum parvum UCRNP2]